MTVVVSSSALAALTVSQPLLKNDTLLHLVTKLASPLQLKVVEKKKGNDLELKLQSGLVLAERNAILRSLCGAALHYALDMAPLLLLGGHSIQSKASPLSAMALAGISSWQSVADTVKHKPETASTLMQQLNEYLETRAFLVPSCQCTLADMDLALALGHALKKDTDVTALPHVHRWMHQVYAVLNDYAACHHDVQIPPLQIEPAAAAAIPTPIFFYGTENYVPPPAAAAAASGSNKPLAPANQNTAAAVAVASNKNADGLTDEQKQAAAEKRAKKAEQKKQKKPPQSKADAVDEGAAVLDISALDIRVGKILKAWHHPEAEKLFCEEIDVGEDKPRQIASGLRPFYKAQDLENRIVLVLCNLKARTMLGFPSHGMVLCASNQEHTKVECVVPPPDCQIGERVMFQGVEMKEPEPENKVAKKKYFETLAPDLKTNGEGVVVWKEHVATTSKGTVTAGLFNAQVS